MLLGGAYSYLKEVFVGPWVGGLEPGILFRRYLECVRLKSTVTTIVGAVGKATN